MREHLPTPESSDPLCDAALKACVPFIEKGLRTPDAIPLDDSAHKLFNEWKEALDQKAEGNPVAQLKADIAASMFYIEAGFTDPEYAEEVDSWLMEDYERIKNLPEGADKSELIEHIQAARAKVKALFKESSESTLENPPQNEIPSLFQSKIKEAEALDGEGKLLSAIGTLATALNDPRFKKTISEEERKRMMALKDELQKKRKEKQSAS